MNDYRQMQWPAAVFGLSILLGGCASFKGVVKPTPKMSLLSPQAEKLTEDEIDAYLSADVSVDFPTVVALAKIKSTRNRRYYSNENRPRLALSMIHGDEANRWRGMSSAKSKGGDTPISQTHLLNRLAVGDEVSLKSLRDAAASFHAPVLFVYTQEDERASGFNDLAMAYWTIVGLFFVPGNTVAHYSVCQGILVDTRTGVMLATISAEAKKQENVLNGAVPIATDRTRAQARAEAMSKFQNEVARVIAELAKTAQEQDTTAAKNQ